MKPRKAGYWNDRRRVRRLETLIREMRHTLGLMERILSHFEEGSAPNRTLDTLEGEIAP